MTEDADDPSGEGWCHLRLKAHLHDKRFGHGTLKMSTRAKTLISLFTCLHENFLQVHFDNKHRAHTVPNRKRHFYLLFTTVYFISD